MILKYMIHSIKSTEKKKRAAEAALLFSLNDLNLYSFRVFDLLKM